MNSTDNSIRSLNATVVEGNHTEPPPSLPSKALRQITRAPRTKWRDTLANHWTNIYRDALTYRKNLAILIEKIGLNYRARGDINNALKFTKKEDQAEMRDFFEYTQMPEGHFATCNAMGSFSKCDIYYPAKDSAGLEDATKNIRSLVGKNAKGREVFGQDYSGRMSNLSDFIQLLKHLNIGVADVEVEKAIYRWGIRASQAALARVGVFYEATEIGKPDRVYLVDLDSKNNWGKARTKRVQGNNIETVNLYSYPNRPYLIKLLEDKRGKNFDQRSVTLNDPDDLKLLLESFGFEVPGAVETEKYIANNPLITRPYLEAKLNKAKNPQARGIYELESLVNVVQSHLIEEQGYKTAQAYKPGWCDIRRRVNDLFVPYILFADDKSKYIGRIEAGGHNDVTNQRIRLKEEARNLHRIPVAIKVKEYDHRNRKIQNLEIKKLSA